MENQINDLLQFIYDRFANIRFGVIHNSFSPTLKHFVIKDQNGEKGFGTDHDFRLAIEKAYSEFIERKTFHELHRIFDQFETSNGFAAHPNLKEAKQASIYELIERDALLLTWHGRTSPYWITDEEVKKMIFPENLEIKRKHQELGLKLSIGILAKHGKNLTCIAKVKGRFKSKDFFYIDTKTGTNLAILLNSLVESITFYSHYIGLGHLDKIKQASHNLDQPIRHFYHYLYHSRDVNWFHKSSSSLMEIPTAKINTYTIDPEEFLDRKELKRVVCYSESEIMQPYYCGNFDKEKINTKRFQQIFGRKIKYNKQLHPLS